MRRRLWNACKSLLSPTGNLSMVRLLSFICVVTACVLGLIGICTTSHTLESVAVLCGTFLGAGLGAKVMQRSIETSATLSNNSTTLNDGTTGDKSRTSTVVRNVGESGDYEDKK